MIRIAGHNNFLLEKPNIIASDTKKKAAMIKLYLIDLKNEITESIRASAKIQLLCLEIKWGIFQRKTITG
jgi:hypothetical protein